jgi:hypothetical protein
MLQHEGRGALGCAQAGDLGTGSTEPASCGPTALSEGRLHWRPHRMQSRSKYLYM